jgi:hypothetical protein
VSDEYGWKRMKIERGGVGYCLTCLAAEKLEVLHAKVTARRREFCPPGHCLVCDRPLGPPLAPDRS